MDVHIDLPFDFTPRIPPLVVGPHVDVKSNVALPIVDHLENAKFEVSPLV